MRKTWLRLALGAVWLGLGLAARGQYLPPGATGPTHWQEPMPVQAKDAPKPPPNLIPGPLTPEIAPPGPAVSDEYALSPEDPSAFSIENHTFYPCGPQPSRLAVDFLIWTRRAGKRDLAFSTNRAQPGIGGPGDVFFDSPTEFIPRANILLMFSEDWGISGTYYRSPTFSQTFSFVNTDVSQTFASALIPFGPSSIVSTITGGNASTPRTVVVPLILQVRSQQPFYYLPLLPTRTLFNDPNNANRPANSPINQRFEYTSNLAAGFPESFQVHSEFRMETAELFAERAWEGTDTRGTMGLGIHYAYFKHVYLADRVNAGGPLPTRYDPQDGDQDLNSIDPQSRFEDGPDFDHFHYIYTYQGFGSKLKIQGNWPKTGTLQTYFKVAGGLLWGFRKETTFIDTVQNGTFVNRDTQAEINMFNGGRLTFSRALRGPFTRSRLMIMPAGELEGGFDIHVGSPGGIDPVVRLGGFAQYYHNAGSSSTKPNSDLILLGGVVSVGFEF